MSASNPTDYVLGHSASELRRLEEQAQFFGSLTRLVFQEAGLSEGMRVLDAGSGAGDVSLLAGTFVGPSGEVVGVDRSEQAVKAANDRAQRNNAKQVRFITGDAAAMNFEQKFDAIVGRLVLMYHPRPAEMLQHLARQLRPGGLLIFHEIDTGHLVAEPSCPLYGQITSMIVRTLLAAGADPVIGLKLHEIYVEAGLPAPRILITGRADGGPDTPAYDVFADLVRTLLPAAEKFGIVKPGEINLTTLADDLRAQVCAGGGIMLSPLLVGAWSAKK